MDTDEGELELGLGLGLGLSLGCKRMILTAGDLPNGSLSSRTGTAVDAAASVSGTKKTFPLTDPASTAVSQVVGWPPVGAYRMNSLTSLTKPAEEDMAVKEDKGEELAKKLNDPSNRNEAARKEIKTHIGFVKVNMDGLPIGRKVDLNAHVCYETLAQAIEDMFSQSATSATICGKKEQATMNSKLLDGSSEFVLTYEDKEGDWMLVGDVPWGMFLSTVKRLRIMRTSEANGLAPRFQERNARQRIEPI